MDLEKLKADMESDPQLAFVRHLPVEEVAQALTRVHRSMMSQKYPLLYAYLYRQQTLKNTELKKELKR